MRFLQEIEDGHSERFIRHAQNDLSWMDRERQFGWEESSNLNHIEEMMEKLPSKTLDIGYGGIRFFAVDELESIQSLYLENETEGGWNPEWIVIGVEESLDDPVFVDSFESGYPVYTAIHGEGEWEPVCIAPSMIAFLRAILIIKEYSKGRENPVSLEKNPLSNQEFQKLKAALYEVLCRDSDTQLDLDFWLDNRRAVSTVLVISQPFQK